jgi:hypothetical protein
MPTKTLIICAYSLIGIYILTCSHARKALRDRSVIRERVPPWKIAAFYVIMLTVAALFWPLFLGSWFKRSKTAWDVLQENPMIQEQKELFERLSLLCQDGCDADEIPGGYGEFGLSPTNPIPTHTIFGSTWYLSRLKTENGNKVVYQRHSSMELPPGPRPIDVYYVQHPDGTHLTTLYISPYHKRNSSRAPKGLRLAKAQ